MDKLIKYKRIINKGVELRKSSKRKSEISKNNIINFRKYCNEGIKILILSLFMLGIIVNMSCSKPNDLSPENENNEPPETPLTVEDLCKTWVLIEKNKNNVIEVLPNRDTLIYSVDVTLTFYPTGIFRGSCDQNTYRGTYEINENSILFYGEDFTDGAAGAWYLDYLYIFYKYVSTYKASLDINNLQLLNQADSITFKYISKELFEETYYELNRTYDF